MTTENPDFRRFRELTAILDEPQFSRRDVLDLTGLTDAQLKNTLDRDLVRLASVHNPGTGRRRMFTGGDILKIIGAHTMSAIGFPMRWSYLIADQIERRASNRLIGNDLTPDLTIVTFPRPDGDWEMVPMWEGRQDQPQLPVAVQGLQVDRLIDEVLAKLRALVADEPVPSFDVPVSQPEPSPWSPQNDFFRRWAKDDEGNDVLIGLTKPETDEYERLVALNLNQRTDEAMPETNEARQRRGKRYLALHNKHERARQQRLAREFEERRAAAEKADDE